MKIPRAELAAVIGEKTLHETNLKRLATTVAAYLMEQKSIGELESLMRDVMAYRQAHGVYEADVTSAHELSAEALKEVRQLIRQQYPDAKHIFAHDEVDESVIGGLKVTLAHEQLDLSVRAQLDTFKRLTTEGMN
jgi:F0F1-type ATP synthase delta subunit